MAVLCLRVPEILRSCVRIEMGGQVVVYALAEGFLAQVVLDHIQNRAGLAVGDAVEHLIDFIGCVRLRPDRPRRPRRIQVERTVQIGCDTLRYVPLRMPGLQRLILHPRGEAFIQPDIVPPIHGDHVAEPLVRHLVGDDYTYPLLCAQRSRLFVDQQVGLAVSNRAEVLHRPSFEVRDPYHVQLRHGIFDSEIGVVIMQDVLRRAHRKLTLLVLVRSRASADRHALTLARDTLEVAYQECHKIGRHLRRRGELHRVLAQHRARRIGNHIGVRDDGIALVHCQLNIERRLERRLIKRRKRPPRIGRFKLRHRIISLRRLGQIEPAKLIVQNARVLDLQRQFARRNRRVECQRRLLFLFIGRYHGLEFAPVRHRHHAAELDLRRIQRDRLNRLRKCQVNGLASSECRVFKIRRQRERVMLRNGYFGQSLCLCVLLDRKRENCKSGQREADTNGETI